MPLTKTIEIKNPVLVSPTTFTVSYRLVGAPTWTLLGARTNAPFSLTVPTAGEYEILIEYLDCEDSVVGPITFAEDPPCECPTITDAQIINIDAVTTVARFTFSGTIPTSPCGWVLTLRNKRTGVSRIFATTILTNPLERLVDRGDDYDYVLYADCCAQVKSFCAQGTLEAADEVPQCVPVELKNDGNVGKLASFDPAIGWYFDLDFKQSTPPTAALSVVYVQSLSGPPSGGTPDSGATVLIPVAGPDPTFNWRVRIPVNPNPFMIAVYIIAVKDTICGGPDIFWR